MWMLVESLYMLTNMQGGVLQSPPAVPNLASFHGLHTVRNLHTC